MGKSGKELRAAFMNRMEKEAWVYAMLDVQIPAYWWLSGWFCQTSPSNRLCADKHIPIAGNGLGCKCEFKITVIHPVAVKALDLPF